MGSGSLWGEGKMDLSRSLSRQAFSFPVSLSTGTGVPLLETGSPSFDFWGEDLHFWGLGAGIVVGEEGLQNFYGNLPGPSEAPRDVRRVWSKKKVVPMRPSKLCCGQPLETFDQALWTPLETLPLLTPSSSLGGPSPTPPAAPSRPPSPLWTLSGPPQLPSPSSSPS